MSTRLSELRKKELVDITTGIRLGEIVDLDIDMTTGQIVALIAPGTNGIWGVLKRAEDYIIPWTKIKIIGKDVILVEGLNLNVNR